MKKNIVFILMIVLLWSCKTTKDSVNYTDVIVFKTSKTTIENNEKVTLSWQVPIEIEDATISIPGVGSNLSYSGSKDVYPTQTQTYNLDIKASDKTYSKSITISIKEKPQPSISNFSANKSTVDFGNAVTLSWNVANISDEKIIIEGLNNPDVANSGTITIYPTEDHKFTLKVMKNQSVITEKSVNIDVKIPVKFSVGPDDGRFTIGGDGKRLMYGWPVPQSTSHFIVKVNDNYGSNRPSFTGDNKFYLSGNLVSVGEKGSVHLEIPYYLDGVKIVQKLIPVDDKLKPVDVNSFGQYYKIEYEITNLSGQTKSIGLISLIDFMIDNNDAAQVSIGGKIVENETSISKESIVDDLFIMQDANDPTKARAQAIFKGSEAVTPDNLYVGKWSYLHGVVWSLDIEGDKYGDSGMLLKWDDVSLENGSELKVAYYYGLPNNGKIAAVTSVNNLKLKSVTINFPLNGYVLDNESSNKIDSVLNSSAGNIVGVLVSGYADARGLDEFNLKISENRVNSVTKYLKIKGINKSLIIPKFYGESSADQNEEAILNGKDTDRKCEIIFFTK